MNTRAILSHIAAVMCLAGCWTDSADAGTVVVTGADVGSFVSIQYSSAGTNIFQSTHADMDGRADFPLAGIEDLIPTVFVCKDVKAVRQWAEEKVTPPITFALLEPFNYPSFAATTTLVAVTDIGSLIAQGVQFNLGDILTVTNGSIAQTSAILFKDGSSLVPDPIFTQTLVNSLPNYSGTAIVQSFDQFQPPIPEPSTWVLLSLGIFSLLGYRSAKANRA